MLIHLERILKLQRITNSLSRRKKIYESKAIKLHEINKKLDDMKDLLRRM